MSKWSTLKAAIANVIKTNGTQAITGSVLQNVLNNIVSSLGENYQFVGIATTLTNPGTPDGNVFYLAGEGIYANFSNLVIDTGQLGILIWNGSWSKQTLEIGAGGGNMILEWNTDVATTRKQALSKYRKSLLQISYKNANGDVINEQYIGTSITDTEWTKDSNWDKIPNEVQFTELDISTKKNEASIDCINGKIVSKAFSASLKGTNAFTIPVLKNQNIKITVDAPASSRLLGIELSNELSTSGTDKQRLFWGEINSEKIVSATANKDYKYLLIELWTDETLNGTFEYQNEQKYALQKDFLETAEKTNYAYDNASNALSQYSFSDKSANYPDDIFDSALSYSDTWIGGGHKIIAGDKKIYGASIYVEFNSEDIYQNEEENEVIVFLTDTIPTQGILLKDLNRIYSASIHANKKGFYDVRFNAPFVSDGNIFLFAYGVNNSLKYSNKKKEEKPFTNDFYFINRPNTLDNANISVYDTDWILQPTIIFYTENELLQRSVLDHSERIGKIEESLNSFGDALVNIIDKPFSFNSKKVKAYQDSFGSFVLAKSTFVKPLEITLEKNAKGERTLTTPAGTEKQGTPNNENVLEYAMDDLISDDYYTIIIALGTNDLGGVIRGTILLGDWDSEDTSTLYGALNYAANRCKTYAPSAKVILISPINRTNGWDGTAMQIIRNAIRNKALANGFSILDGSTSPFPFVENDLSKVCWNNNDGLHPVNGIGSKMYDMWVLGNLL